MLWQYLIWTSGEGLLEEVSYGISRNLPNKKEGKQSSEQRVQHVLRPEGRRPTVLGHWKKSSLESFVHRKRKEIKLKMLIWVGWWRAWLWNLAFILNALENH